MENWHASKILFSLPFLILKVRHHAINWMCSCVLVRWLCSFLVLSHSLRVNMRSGGEPGMFPACYSFHGFWTFQTVTVAPHSAWTGVPLVAVVYTLHKCELSAEFSFQGGWGLGMRVFLPRVLLLLENVPLPPNLIPRPLPLPLGTGVVAWEWGYFYPGYCSC